MPPSGGVWHLTGSLVSNKVEVLRFEENVVTAFSGSWDVSLVGTRLTVKAESGTVAEIHFDAEAGEVRVEHLRMSLAGGNSMELTPGGVEIKNADGNTFITLSGNRGSGDFSAPPIIIGGASMSATGDSMALGLSTLGDFHDWVKGDDDNDNG